MNHHQSRLPPLSKKILTIATRRSPLALWQANFIKDALIAHDPALSIELLEMSTQGDKILDTPLAKIGGKGLFVKELEQALLDGRADLAVHSLKDVPMVLPDGLVLAAFCVRHDPSDAFVSNHFVSLDHLPKNATVGTSSLRRACQALAVRPDLSLLPLRGNVGTRLAKLDGGDYDAIILASSGLERLGLGERIRQKLPLALSLPAVGQGVLALECPADSAFLSLFEQLDDAATRLCALAERAMNQALNGGCQVPIAGFANLADGVLALEGRVGSADGRRLLKVKESAALLGSSYGEQTQDAKRLGQNVAAQLLVEGADEILAKLYHG